MSFIDVNVGGHVYTTTEETLCKVTDSMLARLFDRTSPHYRDMPEDYDGRSFIDRDGPAFAAVLAWLRTGVASVPSGVPVHVVQQELQYFFPGPGCPLAVTPGLASLYELPYYSEWIEHAATALQRALAANDIKVLFADERKLFHEPGTFVNELKHSPGMEGWIVSILMRDIWTDSREILSRVSVLEWERALCHMFSADSVEVNVSTNSMNVFIKRQKQETRKRSRDA